MQVKINQVSGSETSFILGTPVLMVANNYSHPPITPSSSAGTTGSQTEQHIQPTGNFKKPGKCKMDSGWLRLFHATAQILTGGE